MESAKKDRLGDLGGESVPRPAAGRNLLYNQHGQGLSYRQGEYDETDRRIE